MPFVPSPSHYSGGTMSIAGSRYDEFGDAGDHYPVVGWAERIAGQTGSTAAGRAV
jgi:hypothetical protein